MLDKTTLNQLHDLHLHTLAATLNTQQDQPEVLSLSFEERLGILVEAEWMKRRENRIDRIIRQAQFRFSAVVEDIEYHGKQGITKKDIQKLCDCAFIRKKQNILLSGPTGVGKTYLACALGRSACYQCYSVRYIRTNDLFLELADARMEGKYSAYRKNLSRVSMLILDDWGMRSFTEDESHEILELMEMRYQASSTVIVSQPPYSEWHQLFPDPTLADAVLDRIIHNSYKFNIIGESMRKTLAEKDFDRES